MRILPLLLTGLLLAGCEPPMPFERSDDSGNSEPGEAKPTRAATGTRILQTSTIEGTDWLLAEVGWRDNDRAPSGMSSSYKSMRPVANVVILDKTTGASVALLPDERSILSGHWIIWPIPGVVEHDDGAPQDAHGVAPTHFMLDVEPLDQRGRANPASRRLLVGTLSDYSSAQVARGYTDIHHVEMLDGQRLSILLGYPDRDELVVIDLPAQTITLRKRIDPVRVSK